MEDEQIDVKQILRSQLASKGWDIIYKLDVERKDTPNLFEASMESYSWQLNVTLDTAFEEKLGKIAEKSKLNIQTPVQKALRSIVDHEMGHWELCPSDIVYLESMLNSVSKGLSNGGMSEQEVKQFSPYVTNMFSDAVINCSHMREKDFSEGYGLLQASRAYTSPSALENGKPHFEDYFGMFTDIQMKLARDKGIRKIGERYVNNYSAIAKMSEQLLGTLIGKDLAKKAFSNSLRKEDMDDIVYALKDKDSWNMKSKRFAQIIAPYLKNHIDDMQKNQHLMPSLSGICVSDSEDSQETSENDRTIIKQGLDRLEAEAKEESEKTGGEEGAKARKKGKDEDARERVGQKIAGYGGTDMKYAARHEVYDELYRRTAGQIVLNFLDKGEEAPSLTLFHMARRRLEDGEQLDNTVAWERTIFVNGEPWLFKKEMPFDIDSPGPSSKGSYEDILFIVDVSGSMGWQDIPLDGSKYDMAIRAVYSVMNYLEKSGKAPFLNYGLMQFSYDTDWSGWKNYRQSGALTKRLFTGFQGGGTLLDPDKVNAADSRPSKHFLTIMISDGEIANSEEAFNACSRVAVDHKNDFVLFQIESESDFGDKMRGIGVPVISINQPEDLIGITLDIVRSKYAPILRQGASPARNTKKEDLLDQARDRDITQPKPSAKKIHP